MILNDPLTGNAVRVTKDGEQLSLAVSEAEIEFVSHEKGLAFIATSTYSATGGEEILSIRNDNADLDMIVQNITVSTSASGVFTLFEMTTGQTPAGTTVTPVNLNLGSAVVAQATCFGNASVTGSLSGTTLTAHDVGTSTPYTFDLHTALIIPKDSTIVLQAATTGVVYADIVFYYASKIAF